MTDSVDFDYLEHPCLTKAHLSAMLCDRLGITHREARALVDSFFGLIAERLTRGEDVKIANFGNFELRRKTARPGRNPRTGDVVTIQGRRTVKFFASTKQKDLLQGKAARKTHATPSSPRQTQTLPERALQELPTSAP